MTDTGSSTPGQAPHALARAASGYTVAALFERAFRVFADRTAVTSVDGSWTYREVGERSRRLAAGLRSLGLQKGDRVAILSQTRPEYVECYAALASIGVTALTLNTRMHPAELAYCLESGAPAAVVVAGSFEETVRRLRAAWPSAVPWVCLDGTTPDAISYASLLQHDEGATGPAPGPDDIHNVLYTSGTTGRPKGAMISQSAAAVRGLRLAQWFHLTPEDGFVGWLPMFHCGGDESLYATFTTGGTFATMRTADPDTMYAMIERDRLTWTLFLPGVITDYLHGPGRPEHDLSSMRFGIGYANMMPHVVEQLTRECEMDFFDAFGQTEASYLVAHGLSRPGQPPSLRKQPSPLMQLRLVDEAMRDVEPGTPGECVVRGPSVMSGYLDDPDATSAAFAGGWLHTGDVLVANDDGTLTFVDRTKYLIKTGGENVYPADVELVLTSHPGVAEACVFGVPDERWGETVKAVIVRQEGSRVEAPELVAWCRERLGGYKRPRYLVFMASEDLPRSTTGKLQRHVLAAVPPDPAESV